MIYSDAFYCSLLLALAILACLREACSIQFNYTSFSTNSSSDLNFTTSSSIANGALQITPTSGNLTNQSGRVFYKEPFKLWHGNSSILTSFNATFVLNINPLTRPGGEGMAWILTSNPALPSNSSGQWLGIANNQTSGSSVNRVVGIEFDTRKSYPEDLDDNHVGLDLNSIKSAKQFSFSNVLIDLSSGSDVTVSIQYYGLLKVLAIYATQTNETSQETYFFTYRWPLDLSRHLMEDVYVGFSASTSNFTQLNQIKSWSFTTSEDAVRAKKIKSNERLMWLLTILIILPFCLGFIYCIRRSSKLKYHEKLLSQNIELMIDGDARGPVKFRLKDLKSATANFDSSRKLGEGGFGTVYRGHLRDMNREVAVKRVSGNSHRGEQEFISEVNIISQLSHRNLVKLIGWCHEKGELILVYEFMPMGSLDKLLFPKGRSTQLPSPVLNWERRYKIICGVASALDYLHYGSNKRVLHRDVKSSNVMLDEDYNGRLGDFGLARVVQHDGMTHHSTAALAGTRGYIAPECYFTGRASPETDVYGFGVFVMEVACGRRPGKNVTHYEGEGDITTSDQKYIVDWLWELYGKGKELDAADVRLGGEYDEVQMSCVLKLALVCCHPSPRKRPSVRMVVQVLVDGAPTPHVQPEKPAFVWPEMNTGQDVELPTVGLLFGSGQMSFTSISGR
ncbi:probable L-type lectin-domain containing receptor kinase S.5 [Typha angustifolia]|uniref:probable L-type lectin-domain containing receptor kinase S.5 n=1 Tax=Typha angustifolia TaxID=59011 RepID=UPI003C2BEDA0